MAKATKKFRAVIEYPSGARVMVLPRTRRNTTLFEALDKAERALDRKARSIRRTDNVDLRGHIYEIDEVGREIDWIAMAL